MPFPVTVYGQVYNESDFSGLGYVTSLPATLSKLADLNAAVRGWASTSSVAIGTDAKSFTIAAGVVELLTYSLASFDSIYIFHNATNYMIGTMTGYNPVTGVIQVFVWKAVGAGTYTSWTVTLAAKNTDRLNTVLPLGGASGGTGTMKETYSTASPVTFFQPLPGTGFIIEDDFYPKLPIITLEGNRDTHWAYRSGQATGAGPLGSFSTKIIGFALVSPVDPDYAAASTLPALSLGLGTQGFLSVGSPGDIHFAALLAFSTNLYDDIGATEFFFGLRGEASGYNNIFDKYGLGFKAVTKADNTRDWYAVCSLNGVTTSKLLFNAQYAFCSIWVDSFEKKAFFHATDLAASVPSPGDLDAYPHSVSIEGWPDEDPISFVHPAGGCVVPVGFTLAAIMYVDRISLYKALER